jgi:hypothetical protein
MKLIKKIENKVTEQLTYYNKKSSNRHLKHLTTCNLGVLAHIPIYKLLLQYSNVYRFQL